MNPPLSKKKVTSKHQFSPTARGEKRSRPYASQKSIFFVVGTSTRSSTRSCLRYIRVRTNVSSSHLSSVAHSIAGTALLTAQMCPSEGPPLNGSNDPYKSEPYHCFRKLEGDRAASTAAAEAHRTVARIGFPAIDTPPKTFSCPAPIIISTLNRIRCIHFFKQISLVAAGRYPKYYRASHKTTGLPAATVI